MGPPSRPFEIVVHQERNQIGAPWEVVRFPEQKSIEIRDDRGMTIAHTPYTRETSAIVHAANYLAVDAVNSVHGIVAALVPERDRAWTGLHWDEESAENLAILRSALDAALVRSDLLEPFPASLALNKILEQSGGNGHATPADTLRRHFQSLKDKFDFPVQERFISQTRGLETTISDGCWGDALISFVLYPKPPAKLVELLAERDQINLQMLPFLEGELHGENLLGGDRAAFNKIIKLQKQNQKELLKNGWLRLDRQMKGGSVVATMMRSFLQWSGTPSGILPLLVDGLKAEFSVGGPFLQKIIDRVPSTPDALNYLLRLGTNGFEVSVPEIYEKAGEAIARRTSPPASHLPQSSVGMWLSAHRRIRAKVPEQPKLL